VREQRRERPRRDVDVAVDDGGGDRRHQPGSRPSP